MFQELLKFGKAAVQKPVANMEKIFDDFTSGDMMQKMDSNFEKRLEKVKFDKHRLRNAFAAPINVMVPGFVPPEYPKTPQETEFLETAMADAFVLTQVKGGERKRVMKAFERWPVKTGDVVIKEKEIGRYFYLIQTGTIQFFKAPEMVKPVGEATMGGSFGEIALLFDCPRAATAIAETDCVLWRLDQHTYRRVIAQFNLEADQGTKAILQKISIFENLDDEFLTQIAQSLSMETYEEGEEIIHRGSECTSFYIIKEGKIKGTDIKVAGSSYDDIVLDAGNFFGEGSIMNNNPIQGTIVAMEKTTLLTMSREIFLKLFGDFDTLIRQSSDAKRLRGIPNIVGGERKLEDHEAQALAAMVENKTFPKGHTFFYEGRYETPALYFVRGGKISVRSSVVEAMESLAGIFGHKKEGSGLTVVTKGGFFGADMLNAPGGAETSLSRFSFKVEEDCEVGVLTMREIWSVVTGRPKAEKIAFGDLEKHTLLGCGTFGKVYLASQKGSNTVYALKEQGKRKVIDYNQASGVVREMKIMQRLDHPFIIRLVASYQDKPNIYMLTGLYQGGELRSLISSGFRKWMPEKVAKFYAAGILEGMSFMHKRKILHRDLKPENVLIDAEGYTVLIDLGFAKFVPSKTYTICGTPLYMCPELFNQQGYDKSADVWSWGCILYEMTIGMTPFLDDTIKTQIDLCKRICSGKFDFPYGNFLSSDAKNLIRQVLAVNPKERLGCLAGGDMDIKSHPFFRGVDFHKFAKKELKAPYVPKIKDPLDAGNFDEWEEPEDDKAGKPLTDEEQAIFKDF